MKKLQWQYFIPLIITMPSIAIGAIAMYHYKIPTFIWAQNIACLVIAGLISFFMISNKFNLIRSNSNSISIIISVLLLILTFVNPGINGVHRWLAIGSFKVNVSMIVVPVVMITLWNFLFLKELLFSIVIALTVSILLAAQPDASQLTGFAIPIMIMMCSKTDKKILRSLIIGIFSALIIVSWIFLDHLPPVAYVEEIMSLLADMGLIWFILGIISLVILPVPFIFFPPKKLKLPSISLGLYFTIILIATIFGNFPVPLMGYGISPIIGYYIAITWYTKARISS